MKIYKQATITGNISAYLFIKPNNEAISLLLTDNELTDLKRDLNATEASKSDMIGKLQYLTIVPRSEFDNFFKTVEV